MSIERDKINASMMRPDDMVTPSVTTEVLTLGNRILTGVMSDLRDSNTEHIVPANMLEQVRMGLQANIDKIDPDNIFFKDNSVISNPLLPLNLQDSTWVYDNWGVDESVLIYVSTPETQYNKIYIENKHILTQSYYFLAITVSRLDSGILEIRNHEDQLLATIDKTGTHYLEIYIDDALVNVASYYITAKDVNLGEIVTTPTIGFYRVATRFKDYVTFWLTSYIASAGDALVTNDILNKAIQDLKDELSAGGGSGSIEIDFQAHLLSGNPHNINIDKINAAAREHNHTVTDITDLTPLSIGAAERVHRHNLVDLDGITPETIGASPTTHTHDLYQLNGITPSAIGAAAISHSHPEIEQQIQAISSTTYERLPSKWVLNIDTKEPGFEGSVCDPHMSIKYLSLIPGEDDSFPPTPEPEDPEETPITPSLTINGYGPNGITSITLDENSDIKEYIDPKGPSNYVYLVTHTVEVPIPETDPVETIPVTTITKMFTPLPHYIDYHKHTVDGADMGIAIGEYGTESELVLPRMNKLSGVISDFNPACIPDDGTFTGMYFLGMNPRIRDQYGNTIYSTIPYKPRTIVPINNFTDVTGTFLVDNIYRTPYIVVNVLSNTEVAEGEIFSVKVTKVTPAVIEVEVDTPGSHFLDIQRTF